MGIHLERAVGVRLLAYAVLCLGVFYGLHLLIPNKYWVLGLLSGGGFSMAMAFVLKVLHLREIIQLARSRQQE
jgi:hypothetical protein